MPTMTDKKLVSRLGLELYNLLFGSAWKDNSNIPNYNAPRKQVGQKARAKVTIVTFIKHIKECLKTKRSCMRDKKYTSVHSCAPVSFVVKWNSSGLSAPSIMSEHHQQHITVLSVIQQFACHNYE